jgi:hypothetical protein
MVLKRILPFVLGSLVVSSCGKRSRTHVITDFSQPVFDTLVPYEKPLKPYGVALFKVQGSVNDTIAIRFLGLDRKYMGSFSDDLKMEYYGMIPVAFLFDPLQANEGEVRVEYSIE